MFFSGAWINAREILMENTWNKVLFFCKVVGLAAFLKSTTGGWLG